jgi:hypothetical protein
VRGLIRATMLASACLVGSACSLEPVEIGRWDPVEDPSGNLGEGGFVAFWSVWRLENGVVEQVRLTSNFTAELYSEAVDGDVRPVVIELLPIEPAVLPNTLSAQVLDRDGVPVLGFEPSAGGLHFEAELELGWWIELSATQTVVFEVHAKLN